MKKLLIVVDYQKDFVDGALGFDGAEKFEKPIADKITDYRNRGDEIVFTFDTHGEAYMTTEEGRNLPVMHCLEGSDGWQLYGCIGELIEKKRCGITVEFARGDIEQLKKQDMGLGEALDYYRSWIYDVVRYHILDEWEAVSGLDETMNIISEKIKDKF